MARQIQVEIVGDSKSLERAFARSSKSAKDFNNTVTASVSGASLRRQAAGLASGYLAVGTAAAAATAYVKSSVDAASNLNEQISKSQIVFGDSSAALEKWAKTTANSIGIANDEALEATGTFGNLFVTMGIGPKVAATMSRDLVTLAADLAAFNNTSATDALDALRSALVGETEPMRRYGVRLSEARVQQDAMAATGKRNAKALTEQEKAMARYRIILADTVTAQGNFKRTQSEFAQQTKKLRAEMRDLSATVGNALLPAITDVVAEMNEGIGVGRRFAGTIRDLTDAAGELRDEVEKLPGAGGVGGKVGAVAGAGKGWLVNAIVGGTPGLGQLRTAKEILEEIVALTDRFRDQASKPIKFDFSAVNQLTQGLMTQGLAAKDLIELRGRGTFAGTPGGTIEQRNQWFDTRIARALERAQNVGDLKKVAQQLQARINITKDITRKMTLEDDLWRVMQQILGRQAATREQAAQAAEARRQAAAEAARLRTETMFGWLEFAVERAEATKGITDDLKAYRAWEKALLGQIRQEGRTLQLVSELWRVRQRIKGVTDRAGDVDPLAGLKQVSSKQLANILSVGTGITTPGRRALMANISGAQIQPIYINNTVELDGQTVSRNTTRHQARGKHRTAKQTSGRR